MSQALNLRSNNLQVYGPSSLSCLGVSGRAVSISPCPRNECRTLLMSMMSPNCYLRHKSFVCKARFGGQRRDSDFSRQNRHGFSQSWAQLNEERGDSDDLGESEFLSAKNEQLPSLSNSEKHHGIAAPGPRERKIEERLRKVEGLFRKVEAKLGGQAAVEGEKRSEAGKEQNKKMENVDFALKLVKEKIRSLLEEETGRKGLSIKFIVDPRILQQSRKFYEEKGEGFSESGSVVTEEPQQTKRPSGETHSEPGLGAEAESDFELDKDLSSGLEVDQEEDEEEELEAAVQSETDPVTGHAAEFSAAEEDNVDEREAEKQHTELKDLNAMNLDELREVARARGMKGYSELTKSELLELLSADAM